MHQLNIFRQEISLLWLTVIFISVVMLSDETKLTPRYSRHHLLKAIDVTRPTP